MNRRSRTERALADAGFPVRPRNQEQPRTLAEQVWAESGQFLHWLREAAVADPLVLALLRKGGRDPLGPAWPSTDREPHRIRQGARLTVAYWRAVYREAEEAGRGELYRGLAHLYAVHHRGPQANLRPDSPPALRHGTGSMGHALARFANGGDAPAGRAGLWLDAIVRPRSGLPWRQLEPAVGAMRDRGLAPPNWRRLAVDLAHWHHPRDRRRPYALTVPERWSTDYHYPAGNAELS
ncbi:type I-E CRISPR-associated protein Cse2/CasB [Streptomyces tsukubensis]|uniref:type I-E CRISPR-associated protein Cse2/CasB n=1 Tax=Streptomyces tsukubensis TaxID=83656 RepID=UPI00344B983D